MSVDKTLPDHHVNPDELQDIVEHTGVLAHRGGSGAIDFQFVYLGYPFAVRAEAGSRGATVNIRAILGYLPYTSESRRGRYGAMEILQACSQAMGQRVRLADKQRLILSDKRTTRDALTPVNLMSIMVGMLLEAKPYLQLLSEYLTPAAAGDVAKSAVDDESGTPSNQPVNLPAG